MNEELTIGNIYEQLKNLGHSSNGTIFGTELIMKYIKQETKLSDDKADKVFDYCWEQGHPAGLYEVFSYAIEICELLQDILAK